MHLIRPFFFHNHLSNITVSVGRIGKHIQKGNDLLEIEFSQIADLFQSMHINLQIIDVYKEVI